MAMCAGWLWLILFFTGMVAFSMMNTCSSALNKLMSPLVLVAARGLVISVVNGVVLAVARISPTVTSLKLQALLLLRCIVGCCAISSLMEALAYLTVADACVLTATTPFFVTVFAAVFLRQRPPIFTLLVGLLCFVGVVLIAKPSMINHQSTARGAHHFLGVAFALGCACASGIAWTVTHSFGSKIHGLVVTQYFAMLSVPFSLCLLRLRHEEIPSMTSQAMCMLAINGLLGYVGQIGLNFGLQMAPNASSVSMYSYLEVPMSALWAALALGQIPDVLTLSGMGVVGVAITSLTFVKAKAARRASAEDGQCSVTLKHSLLENGVKQQIFSEASDAQ